jgi:hypothetical protein
MSTDTADERPMSYDAQLIAEGRCPDLVIIDTEDGPMSGRCLRPITDKIYLYRAYGDTEAHPTTLPACEGHAEERVGWGAMSEPERAAWERRQDEGSR